MSLDILRRRAAPARVLVCLDLRERTGASPPGTAASRWRDRARSLLHHARRAGWPIAHLLVAYPLAEASRWRAIQGLSPAPTEPVFYVDPEGGSPSHAFLRFANHFAAAELLFMGSTSGGRRLDRLVAGFKDRELAAAVDAMSAPPGAPGVRLTVVSGVIGAAPDLRLIAGGLREEVKP